MNFLNIKCIRLVEKISWTDFIILSFCHFYLYKYTYFVIHTFTHIIVVLFLINYYTYNNLTYQNIISRDDHNKFII